MRISVKTRTGVESQDEFVELLNIYNKYPIHELIIHPRVRNDYYKNKPDWGSFEYAVNNSKNNVCYNGDIFTADDYNRFTNRFVNIDKIMIGRGIVMNPSLIDMINGNEFSMSKLRTFHDEVLNGYLETIQGEVNVLYKMKEIWNLLYVRCPDKSKCIKGIKKTHNMNEYILLVNQIFQEHI